MADFSLLDSRARAHAGAAAFLVVMTMAGLILAVSSEAAHVDLAGPLVLDPYASAMLGDCPIDHAMGAICRPMALCMR